MNTFNYYNAEESAKIKVVNRIYRGIESPLDLYKKLTRIWCADTCAPRMREGWSPDNPTMGQCSITAFLAQDIFGGEVYEMPTDNGGVHCYNCVNGIVFDLTSEQFKEEASKLVYDCSQTGDRNSEKHFQKPEKKARYDYICSRLEKNYSNHVLFVRHGQTVWNIENKICGATDSPLTAEGVKQAKELGEQMFSEGIHADEILYSPLSRARDTAKAISDATGIPMRMDVRLIEQDFGKWEGTPRNAADFKEAKKVFPTSNEGGESMLKMAQRIYNLLDEIKEDSDKTYLLVAHNGIARVVHSYFNELTNEEYAAFGIKNCEIRRYDF